jgi:hypothetical protein
MWPPLETAAAALFEGVPFRADRQPQASHSAGQSGQRANRAGQFLLLLCPISGFCAKQGHSHERYNAQGGDRATDRDDAGLPSFHSTAGIKTRRQISIRPIPSMPYIERKFPLADMAGGA